MSDNLFPDERNETDALDRALAAASFVLAAVLIAWPDIKKAPTVAALVFSLGRQVWRRRFWWMND